VWNLIRLPITVAIASACAASAAAAQTATTGAIAGQVVDATGSALPGVTVEAASPAIIEKVRTAVTDGQGQYKIVDLRPGSYTVSFSLPGFSGLKREGIELNTGFTATVDAELSVGSVEETITVSGASPVVDVQNARTQNVLTREVLDAVPTAKNFQAFAGLTLGAQGSNNSSTGGGDNGGSRGEQPTGLTIHGAGVGVTTVDGMVINTMHTVAGTHRYVFNQLQVQEIVLETSGASAPSQSGGLNVNMVPKDGGNTFSGSFTGEYANRSMQGDNLSDELRAQGLTSTNAIRKIYDVGAGLGGPIIQDKLWFFTAHRAQRGVETLAGRYFNGLQGTLFYEPDLDRPAFTDSYVRDSGARIAWQATAKQKIAIGVNLQDYCRCYSMLTGTGGIPVPESTYHYRMYPNNLVQATWSYPATHRLLLEAGYTLRVEHQVNGKPDETGDTTRPVSELATGIAYGSLFSGNNTNRSNYGDHGSQGQYNTRFALSYVTGSHAFKGGVTALQGQSSIRGEPLYNVQYVFRDRVPSSLNQAAWPINQVSKVKLDFAAFAQDQWTIDNFTLSLGVRFENLHDYNPAQTRPEGEFTPEYRFDAVDNVPNWKDINPRISAAYDLFGNGRTAVKLSVGRFVALHTTDIANRTNPGAAIAALTSRTWNDTNGNYVPDCDLKSRAQNGECGPMANQSFGTTVPQTRYDAEVTEGWHVRPHNWQFSAAVQHELRPGVGLTVGYFRTSHGNFSATDNLAVEPGDYTEYCITAPVDPRLPGSGAPVCGLYDVAPGKFGAVDNLVSRASRFGERSEVYNGVDVSLNARFGRGGIVSGGLSIGHTVTDECASPDFPVQFCRNTLPIAGQAQIKISGAYPLPWGLQASGALQNLPGRAIAATYVATNAEIVPSLGRNLAACGTRVPCTATTTVTIMEPNSQFEDRYTLLDARLSRMFRVARMRVQPRLDIYNLFNSAPVLNQNTRYGTSWLQPLEIFGARFVKVGVQLDF
jgi:hypothetical protein